MRVVGAQKNDLGGIGSGGGERGGGGGGRLVLVAGFVSRPRAGRDKSGVSVLGPEKGTLVILLEGKQRRRAVEVVHGQLRVEKEEVWMIIEEDVKTIGTDRQ